MNGGKGVSGSVWFLKTVDQLIEELGVDPRRGLSAAEVEVRLKKFGPNALKGKPKKSLLALFVAQLKDMLIYVLLAAAIVTIIIGEYTDAVIIVCVVLLNAVIGVFQEQKAGKALEALQQMTTPKALVRRDGEIREINAKDVVPGDVVILDAGRYIPADLRLTESANLQIEESALTGESVPSEKDASARIDDDQTPIGDQKNCAFMTTLVTYGRGEGIAVATGMATEMGKIAKELDADEETLTPLQKKLAELGKSLSVIALVICLVIFIVALIQRRNLFEMFLTAISLAVAAIPEGLPAIVAIVLALGVTRMSRIHAIVKRLPAVETLGAVSVICSDKTGTLTQNKMTVQKIYTFGHLRVVPQEGTATADPNEKELLTTLILCTDATYENGEGTGDPTEIALVALGEIYHLEKKKLVIGRERQAERPFDSDRKLMSTVNRHGKNFRVHTKGAIDNLLNHANRAWIDGKIVPLNEEIAADFLKAAEAMSDQALRVIGAAFKDTETTLAPEQMESDLILAGLVGMIDPPRLEVKDAIQDAKQAGITPVMITGDHQHTAAAIAIDLGIATSLEQSLSGREIDAMPEAEFYEKIDRYRVFARVSPEHKVKIVKAFQSQGKVVSMTGDGVNDAPSLKRADIGVAMGITGTDVSKGASDMILTDDNFTTIVAAVEEGRTIYHNIRKTVIFLLSCNFGEILAIFLPIVFFWPVPLLPTQILWINLITDSLPAIALGVDPGDKKVMQERPRDPKESFFAHGAAFQAIIGGLLIGVLTLLAFTYGLSTRGYGLYSSHIAAGALNEAETMAFVVLAVSQLFYSLSLRSQHESLLKKGLFSNFYLIGAVAVGILLQILVISLPFLARAFHVQPLNFREWLLVIIFALIPLLANESIKAIRRMKKER
ncbi:cation-translocating P-type ATPase [Sporolactobacillus spathodeae]|uniref:cation-translocating P-type ATPase n=1 Tax=Sporolactobacillus spathodeae TaxID=1465502 RepID=UPI0019605871|nr:cation-translocating P-type ATPase [Sporolactobacillus spathodeae]